MSATTAAARPGLRNGPATERRWLPLLGPATVVAIFLVWELLSRTGLLPDYAIPPASAVLGAFVTQLGSGTFWSAVGATVWSAVAGLVILTVIASVVALAVTSSRFVSDSTWFIIEFLKPIPPVALIPLGLLLWGPSPTMKITLVVFGAIWPLLTQLIYGIRAVEGVTLDVARSYRLGFLRTTTHVVAPSILPYALTGLRVSAAIAIVVSVVTEMIGGAAGLGQRIVLAQLANDLPTMYALIMAAGILGLLVNGVFRLLDRPLLFWHPSQRGEHP